MNDTDWFPASHGVGQGHGCCCLGCLVPLVIIGVLLLALVRPARAQYQHDRWDRDQWEHMAAGAATAVVVRGPWTTPSWRDAVWKRGLIQLALSLAYELYQRFAEPWVLPARDTLYDLVADMGGWLGVELLDAAFF